MVSASPSGGGAAWEAELTDAADRDGGSATGDGDEEALDGADATRRTPVALRQRGGYDDGEGAELGRAARWSETTAAIALRSPSHECALRSPAAVRYGVAALAGGAARSGAPASPRYSALVASLYDSGGTVGGGGGDTPLSYGTASTALSSSSRSYLSVCARWHLPGSEGDDATAAGEAGPPPVVAGGNENAPTTPCMAAAAATNLVSPATTLAATMAQELAPCPPSQHSTVGSSSAFSAAPTSGVPPLRRGRILRPGGAAVASAGADSPAVPPAPTTCAALVLSPVAPRSTPAAAGTTCAAAALTQLPLQPCRPAAPRQTRDGGVVAPTPL